MQTVAAVTTPCVNIVPNNCQAKVSDLVTCTLRAGNDTPAATACAAITACHPVTPSPSPPATAP